MPLRQVRDYRLVELTGWTFEQIMDAPAVKLDWLLGVHDAAEAAEAAVRRRSGGGSGGGSRGGRATRREAVS